MEEIDGEYFKIVYRRIGGLEIYPERMEQLLDVYRRIGGLENYPRA